MEEKADAQVRECVKVYSRGLLGFDVEFGVTVL